MVNLSVIGDFLSEKPPSQNTVAIGDIAPPDDTADADSGSGEGSNPKNNDSAAPTFNQEALLQQSYAVLTALSKKDYPTLSTLVHPTKGLTLTPYSTVDPSKDRKLSAADLSKAAENPNLYIWGFWDGIGSPIQLSIPDYFDRFVYNADFYSAPMIGVNTIFSVGNSQENVVAAYPESEFVEFYFPGIDPKNNGFDWCGLKLVFEYVEQEYKLLGLIHSEWTI